MTYERAKKILMQKVPSALIIGCTLYKNYYVFRIADKDVEPDKRMGYWLTGIAMDKYSGKFDLKFSYYRLDDKEREEFDRSEYIEERKQNPYKDS